ncbi:MAG TPA: hypothetical protein VMB05_10400 [Solirubrobacteraceae bacterium]|nr:hypothetical protein [Solirubrobacteraceae bacterium]
MIAVVPVRLLAAICLLATASALALPVSAALAGCLAEQGKRCPSFVQPTAGRPWHVSRIEIGEDGRPSCAHARRLIVSWIKHPASRIYDADTRLYWYRISHTELDFGAGLCGYLKFFAAR